jgi:hypothetical protein
MLNRAHTSSSATSGGELSKAVQTYQGLYYAYPNGLDNLTTSSSALFTKIATVSGANTAGGTYLTPLPLTAGTAAALNSVGITNVVPVVESTSNAAPIPSWDPTFFPYGALPVQPTSSTTGSGITTLASGTSVASLGATAIQNLGLITGATYVVFGVGSYTTMSGKTMDDAPVHFDDNPTFNPTNAYARFGVVFQVTDGSGNALPQALYAGSVSFHQGDDGGVVGTDAHIKEYFNNISTNQ